MRREGASASASHCTGRRQAAGRDRAGTSGMTVTQGAAISVPYTGRVCPQGSEGKASSKRPSQGSRIHPRTAVTKCPRDMKRSAPQPRALLRAQPMPSSPRLRKRARMSLMRARAAHSPERPAHAPRAGCVRATSLPSAAGYSRAGGAAS